MKVTLHILISFIFLVSCEDKSVNKPAPKEWSDDHSVSYNQEINERERIKIALFLEHHQEYKMTCTETGLRYFIYHHESKDAILAKIGQIAQVKLKISLLDGKLCYETNEGDLEDLMIDRNDKESGLNEALKLMSIGDKTKLILPNHLAHGLVGDMDKIPPLAILLIDVELINLK